MQERNDLKLDKTVAVKKYISIPAVLLMFILSLAIISSSMTKPLAHDEEMYCTGGCLMAQGKMIYRDFSYISQMPYHALLYSAVYKITDTTHYLLAGRLISASCDILVMIIIFGIYRTIFKTHIVTGTLLGIAAAIIYVFNPIVDYANGYAWNHDVVILCVMVSLWLFIIADFRKKSSFRLIAAMGALLTLAACMRITTILIVIIFFLMLLAVPANSFMLRIKRILSFLASSFLVLIWPVWLIVNAPRAFYLNLVKASVLNGKWITQTGMGKFGFILASFSTPGYFVLAASAIYLWLIFIILRRVLEVKDKSKVILSAILPIVFFIIAFVPPSVWTQYLAVPVPFVLTSLAIPFLYLCKKASELSYRKYYKTAVFSIGISVLISVISYPVVLYGIPAIIAPETWTPIRVHKISLDIAKEIHESGRVLTLAPLYAIEGGCDIYTELSCGPFFYRVADYLSPEERQVAHVIGPNDISGLFSRKPPSAVITRVDMEVLEQPLIESVTGLNWRKKEYESGPNAYFRIGSNWENRGR